jgi:hypothetical protein
VKDLTRQLLATLVAIQVVAWAGTGLLVVAFAPRLLLLDPTVVEGSKALALWAWLVIIGLVVTATLLAVRRVRPLTDAIAVGARRVDPAHVFALYATPARLVALDLAGTLVVGVATLASGLRPATNDVSTQLALVLLTMTMASVAALPA